MYFFMNTAQLENEWEYKMEDTLKNIIVKIGIFL